MRQGYEPRTHVSVTINYDQPVKFSIDTRAHHGLKKDHDVPLDECFMCPYLQSITVNVTRAFGLRAARTCQITRQRPITAEAERARSQLRQFRHVVSAGAEVMDAQDRRRSHAGNT